MIRSMLTRNAWEHTVRAASVRPRGDRIGTAIDRTPSSTSWSTSVHPSRRVCSMIRRSSALVRDGSLAERLEPRDLEVVVESLVGQVRQEHASHGGRLRGQP